MDGDSLTDTGGYDTHSFIITLISHKMQVDDDRIYRMQVNNDGIYRMDIIRNIIMLRSPTSEWIFHDRQCQLPAVLMYCHHFVWLAYFVIFSQTIHAIIHRLSSRVGQSWTGLNTFRTDLVRF